MKVLITGAAGQLGRELVLRGRKYKWEIQGLTSGDLDIRRQDAVLETVGRSGADLVINAAAYAAVDRAESEKETAFAVNRDGPAWLAAACDQAGVPLIHISTDYVFDGKKQTPYVETDPVSPTSVYGQSKAAGESEVRRYLDRHIILRTAWVYGVYGANFVKTMLRLGQEKETLAVVADQYGCPTSAADLAEAVLTLADQVRQKRTIPWGTYHFCGEGMTTWYGFAEAIFDLAASYVPLTVKTVRPISTAEYPTAAARPACSALDCSLIMEHFGIRPRPWRESLAEMIRSVLASEPDSFDLNK